MNAKSAQTLVIAAAALLVLGLVVGSPAGGLLSFGLAALLAVAPAGFGKGGMRVAAIVVLLAALGLGAATYPEYQKHMDAYRAKARN